MNSLALSRIVEMSSASINSGGRSRTRALLGIALGLSLLPGVASAYKLSPFKDKLFQYPRVLETSHDGAFVRVDYSKQRDLYGRDEVREIRAHSRYVSMKPRRKQKKLTLDVGGRTLKYIALGKLKGGAKSIVIYVHGKGGNRLQGANDWSFGGNFNRIKNLMLRNDGVYISTDVTDFAQQGLADVRALIRTYSSASPGAPVFVACGSMGGYVCWALLKDSAVASRLGGLLLMGSVTDKAFLSSAILTGGGKPVPLYIGHGSEDSVFDWRARKSFFEAVKARRSTYPIRFTLFETGSHGTPIRMTDWRLILNWMLSGKP